MRYLMDENMYGGVVAQLREAGHDIAWVAEDSPSSADPNVLARASREDRVLVTLDAGDFGKLVFADGARAPCGVVLFRFRETNPPEEADFIAGVLDTTAPWSGRFSVIRTGPA